MSKKDREEIFKRQFKGISAHRTAQVFNILNPGIDYRGCNKGYMLSAWSAGKGQLDDKYGGLTRFTEDDLVKAKEKASAWWK